MIKNRGIFDTIFNPVADIGFFGNFPNITINNGAISVPNMKTITFFSGLPSLFYLIFLDYGVLATFDTTGWGFVRWGFVHWGFVRWGFVRAPPVP